MCLFKPPSKKHIRHRSRYIHGTVGEGADSPSVAVATVATVEGAIVVSMGDIVVVLGDRRKVPGTGLSH